MNCVARTARSNTALELSSLKNNISQLAQQLQDEKAKTKIQDDHRFWMIENKHLSQLLKERDETIKSLKKISRQRSNRNPSPSRANRSLEITEQSYKLKIAALQKQIHRLNKTVSELTERCEILQCTVRSQRKQIQVFECQNQRKKTQAQLNISQGRLKYQQMSQELKSRLNSTAKLSKYTDSSSKNSLGVETAPLQFPEGQMHEVKYSGVQFKEPISFKANNSLQNLDLRQTRQILELKAEVESLKHEIRSIRQESEPRDKFWPRQNMGAKEGSFSGEQRQKYEERISSRANMLETLQRRTMQLEREKDWQRSLMEAARTRNYD